MPCDRPPPPVVSVCHGNPSELSYFLAPGDRLDARTRRRVGLLLLEACLKVDVPDGITRVCFGSEAGFALVPAGEADELRRQLRHLITTRRRRP